MIAEVDTRIRRALAGVRQSFRGVLRLVKAAGAVQLVQIDGLAGEQLQDAELFQHYGYTSNPPAGTMAIIVPIGGKTSHGIAVATEHGGYRKKSLATGEVALYTDEGDCVVLNRGRVIRVVAGTQLEVTAPLVTLKASTKVRMETPLVEITGQLTVAGGMAISGGSGVTAAITGQLTVNGNVTTTGTVINNGKNIGSTHVHTGVTAGGANTGAPA